MEENQNNQGGGQGNQFLLGLFGGIAAVSVVAVIVMAFMFVGGANDGNNNGTVAGTLDLGDNQGQAGQLAPTTDVTGVKTFSQKDGADICTEDGKPVVFLFSTTWCPHCTWIIDTFDSTMKEYIDAGKIVAYHWEVDTNDNTLTDTVETTVPPEHLAVYQEFNPQGSIPTFVFGCKYSRIGNGYEAQNDLASEKAEFEALIESMIE